MEIKNKEEFYIGGASGKSTYRTCKTCHNKGRNNYKRSEPKQKYVKKKTGFQKLDDETQKDIINMLNLGWPKKTVAEKYNISYHTFLYWTKHKKIPNLIK